MYFGRIAALVALFLGSAAIATPRSFTIGGEAFSEAEIVDARGQPELGGKAAIRITFSPEGSGRLSVLSRAYDGKALPIVLDGRQLAEPIVQGGIDDGVAQISGDFTLAEADALALKISGKPPLPESMDEP